MSYPRAWMGAVLSAVVAVVLVAPAATPADAARAGAAIISPAPTPTITGLSGYRETRVGETVTGVPGDWDPEATLTFQWLRDDSPVAGATGTTWTSQPRDSTSALTFVVTGTREGHPTEVRESERVFVFDAVQTLTPSPTIQGAPRAGSTLTAVPGEWDAGTTLTYRWWFNLEPLDTPRTPTYVPDESQVGGTLRVEVTAKKSGYEDETRSSGRVYITAADAPLSPTPVVSGDYRVGQTVTVDPGQWTDGATLTYQWVSSGSDVPGATTASFVLRPQDLMQHVRVRVTGTRASGDTVRESSTREVREGQITGPTPTPTMSGTPRVGAVVRAVTGPHDPVARVFHEWFADDVYVGQGATYTPRLEDLGHLLTVRTAYAADGYDVVNRASEGLRVAHGTQTLQPRPTVKGTPTVGRTLKAYAGSRDAGARTTFQWYVGSIPVRGATAAALTLRSTYRGKLVRVLTRTTKAGYTTVSKYSAALRVH